LPPGGDIRALSSDAVGGQLNLLYVGGVLPPLYDLSPIFDVLRRVPGLSLTVCCRESEWSSARFQYDVPANLNVVHRSGAELDLLYAAADVFVMFRSMTGYLEFVMPVKLFEAIGAGVPIITNACSEMGDFVAREGVGWTVNSTMELEQLLRRLTDDAGQVRDVAERVRAVRERHTWQARAGRIIDRLESLRRRGARDSGVEGD
jgi:glycosyltransferase involved in cell wall biosynthesis